ncbi:MAG: general secretion pathway protein GspK [Phycisphaeraceae bacterium]|nr:general secretion pathway protein GspK [Phycisphaeraceae bacterium]
MRRPSPERRRRRGAVVIIVVWSLGIAAMLTASVQLFATRQAMLGHDSVHRIQARWAARGGIENTIAILGWHTEDPVPDDAFALYRDLAFVSRAPLHDASYEISHHVRGRNFPGPMDEHSKININLGNVPLLELLDDMTPDQAAAIMDWVDEDEDPNMFGAERDHYLANYSYLPRNGPMRHISELELVAGIWPDFVRGEDFNLNNRLDPNENDGPRSFPDDNADGILDAGWAQSLTTATVDHGSTRTGLPRIHLRRAEPREVMERLGVTEPQARRLIAFGRVPENRLEQLLVVPLNQISPTGQTTGQQTPDPALEPLTREQLEAALDELRMLPLHDRQPGRINLNTVDEDLLRRIMEARNLPTYVADELIYLRNSRPEGITSMAALLELTDTSSQLLQALTELFTTRSDVFAISSVGRSEVSGLEVEIVVTVDRSTVPVRILEYREQ